MSVPRMLTACDCAAVQSWARVASWSSAPPPSCSRSPAARLRRWSRARGRCRCVLAACCDACAGGRGGLAACCRGVKFMLRYSILVLFLCVALSLGTCVGCASGRRQTVRIAPRRSSSGVKQYVRRQRGGKCPPHWPLVVVAVALHVPRPGPRLRPCRSQRCARSLSMSARSRRSLSGPLPGVPAAAAAQGRSGLRASSQPTTRRRARWAAGPGARRACCACTASRPASGRCAGRGPPARSSWVSGNSARRWCRHREARRCGWDVSDCAM